MKKMMNLAVLLVCLISAGASCGANDEAVKPVIPACLIGTFGSNLNECDGKTGRNLELKIIFKQDGTGQFIIPELIKNSNCSLTAADTPEVKIFFTYEIINNNSIKLIVSSVDFFKLGVKSGSIDPVKFKLQLEGIFNETNTSTFICSGATLTFPTFNQGSWIKRN
jgi:hypothetical protein